MHRLKVTRQSLELLDLMVRLIEQPVHALTHEVLSRLAQQRVLAIAPRRVVLGVRVVDRPDRQSAPGVRELSQLAQTLLKRVDLLEPLRQRPHLFLRSLDLSAQLSAAVFALLHLPTLKPAAHPKEAHQRNAYDRKQRARYDGTEPSSPKHKVPRAPASFGRERDRVVLIAAVFQRDLPSDRLWLESGRTPVKHSPRP